MARKYRTPNRPLLNNKPKPIVVLQNYIYSEDDAFMIKKLIGKDYYPVFLNDAFKGVDIKILKP